MLACTALVGCTSDDVVDNLSENTDSKAYMAVKLMMADSASSRATTDGGYEVGTASEQAITAANSIFLFYDANGNYVTSGELIDETPSGSGDNQSHNHTNNVTNSQMGNAYVVLSAPSSDLKNTISQVLTVVNYSGVSDLKNLNLSEALGKVANAETENGAGGFLMTTSVYYSDNNLVNTTAIDGTKHIQTTQVLAKNNPVEIYIERAAVKVQLSYTTTVENTNQTTIITKALTTAIPVEGSEDETEAGTGDEAGGQEGNDITIDGTQHPAYITIEGWTVNNVNLSTNLVKQVEAGWNAANATPLVGNMSWNNPGDYRSYWAKGTKYDNVNLSNEASVGLEAYSYNDAIATKTTESANTELKNIVNDAMYCYEQTITSPTSSVALKGAKYPGVTTVLIAAKIKISKLSENGKSTTIEDAGTLYNYGGVFFSETEYKKLILAKLQSESYKKSVAENTTTDLDVSDLTIDTNNTLAGIKVTVNTNNNYTKNNESITSTNIDNYLNGTETTEAIDLVKQTKGYKDGACYYQIPIEHLSSQTDASKTYLYGVVRNHWYKLDITKIVRIGEAVYNPTVDIPQIPANETNYYMAAKLHVLNWHVVNQEVTLD